MRLLRGVAAVALMAISAFAGDTAAQAFILQGEGLGCDGTDCTVPLNQNLIVNGDLDIAGTGTFDAIDVNLLTVNTSYWLPECPQGYARDTSVTDYILCEKTLAGGTDQMVKVGDFWIDKYEMSAWQNADCTGTQYGASGDNWTMPDNGNWGAGNEAYACSVTGVTPSRYMTWFQAQQSCEAAGKSLCGNAQWQAAAAGTYDPGSAETGNQCRIAVTNTSPRATGLAGANPGGSDSSSPSAVLCSGLSASPGSAILVLMSGFAS